MDLCHKQRNDLQAIATILFSRMDMQRVFIISAPSGTGKNSLINRLIENRDDVQHCVSTTTRKSREGEQDGLHYYFTTTENFIQKVKNEEFLEWAEVLNNFYGTTLAEVSRILKAGKKALLDLDVQGAMNVKKKFNEVKTIFVLPPSIDELRSRLTGRATESAEEIERRIALAEQELQFATMYDHQVINDNFDQALAQINALVK